jgi:hypothetical protein
MNLVFLGVAATVFSLGVAGVFNLAGRAVRGWAGKTAAIPIDPLAGPVDIGPLLDSITATAK